MSHMLDAGSFAFFFRTHDCHSKSGLEKTSGICSSPSEPTELRFLSPLSISFFSLLRVPRTPFSEDNSSQIKVTSLPQSLLSCMTKTAEIGVCEKSFDYLNQGHGEMGRFSFEGYQRGRAYDGDLPIFRSQVRLGPDGLLPSYNVLSDPDLLQTVAAQAKRQLVC
jgi:hypothetical protein